jgi:hypothetical protein
MIIEKKIVFEIQGNNGEIDLSEEFDQAYDALIIPFFQNTVDELEKELSQEFGEEVFIGIGSDDWDATDHLTERYPNLNIEGD